MVKIQRTDIDEGLDRLHTEYTTKKDQAPAVHGIYFCQSTARKNKVVPIGIKYKQLCEIFLDT